MKQIEANNYTIEIGNLVESSFQTLLQTKYAASKKVILVDENTHDFCLEYLLTNFEELTDAEVMLLPVGEENKVMAVCFQVFEALSEYQIGRNDVIINLGGGLVSDMGGFVASIYKRGIDFINIPTSLLAMVDASIGGKTGIDLGPYKNQLGTFTDPKSLFIDVSFLDTLPEEEIMNGYAEMLKHALILDKNYWNELTSLASLDDLLDENLILRSITLKNEVVSSDPFEKNNRKKLNFGHTAGHALEGFFLDSTPISHGHAVGIGMIAETFVSYKKGLLSKDEWESIEQILLAVFPIVNFEKDDIPTLIQLMKNDKKNFEGEVKCCLLTSIGECVIDQNISEDEIKEMFYYLIAMLS
jgi:3-dehydroquinate synthase